MTKDKSEFISQPPVVQIEHLGPKDVIFPTYVSPPDRDRLRAFIADNAPANWTYFNVTSSHSSEMWVSPGQTPKYICKQRWLDYDLNIKAYNRKEDLPYASVINEISIANQVESLVSNDHILQAEVKSYGYSGLSVVKPIAATINHQERDKYVFYRFIRKEIPTNEFHTDAICLSLENIFKANGVCSDDLASHQFITHRLSSGVRHLYLIDLEGFSRI